MWQRVATLTPAYKWGNIEVNVPRANALRRESVTMATR
jgi:hypothetical protein